ncbi:hypothetical protein ACWCQL_24415, partial [Streptomyces sp. NPDC002073]
AEALDRERFAAEEAERVAEVREAVAEGAAAGLPGSGSADATGVAGAPAPGVPGAPRVPRPLAASPP